MPEIPQVKTCCLCCTTEVGSKIIGWWLLITGIIQTVSWILILIRTLGPNQPDGSTFNAIVEVILAIFIVLMGVYLLHGVYRRNFRYVKTWLTLATVYLIILAVGIIGLMIKGHWDVLGQIVNFLLVAYFIVVVYSYYRENLNTAPTTY